MNPISQTSPTHRRGHGRALALIAVAVVLSAVALAWCWKIVLHGVFALPDIKFVHAFAMILALAGLGATLGMAWRLGAGGLAAGPKPESAP